MNKCKLDHLNKEVIYDLEDEVDHAHNQSDGENVAEERMWRLLLDSQSACNIIINKELLSNIRSCDWTLRLQTKAGECRSN